MTTLVEDGSNCSSVMSDGAIAPCTSLPVSECQLCFGTAANRVSVSMRTYGRSFSGDAARNIQGCASSSLATQPAWCGLPVVLPLFGHARDLKHRKGKESGVILGIH